MDFLEPLLRPLFRHLLRRSSRLVFINGGPEFDEVSLNRIPLFLQDLLNHLADAFYNVLKSFIAVAPGGNRFRPSWKCLQLAEGCLLPVRCRFEYDRNNARIARGVSGHRPLYFLVPAVFRVQKGGANEQKNEIGSVQLVLNFAVPLGSWQEFAVMPEGDQALVTVHPKRLF